MSGGVVNNPAYSDAAAAAAAAGAPARESGEDWASRMAARHNDAVELDFETAMVPPLPIPVDAFPTYAGGAKFAGKTGLVEQPGGISRLQYTGQDSIFAYNIDAISRNTVNRISNANFGDVLMKIQKRLVLRNQSMGKTGPGAGPGIGYRWELDSGGDAILQPGSANFLSYTFFPVVRAVRKRNTSEVTERVSSMMVIYSSEAPEGMIPHVPNWQPYTVSSNRQIGRNTSTIQVDVRLIGDQNCQKAIESAINTMNPIAGSYLCIVPCVPREAAIAAMDVTSGSIGREDPQYQAHYYRVNGASLGLAFAAAIGGMPPIHYTGYLRTIQGPRTALAKSGSGSTEVMTGPTAGVVEAVDALAYKAWYAMTTQLPLIMPFTTWDGWDASKILESSVTNADQTGSLQRNALYHQLMGSFVTIDQLEAGQDYMAAKAPVLLAKTLADVADLASKAIYAYGILPTIPVATDATRMAAQPLTQTYDSLISRKHVHDAKLEDQKQLRARIKQVSKDRRPAFRRNLAEARLKARSAATVERANRQALKREMSSDLQLQRKLALMDMTKEQRKAIREANPSVLRKYLLQQSGPNRALAAVAEQRAQMRAAVQGIRKAGMPIRKGRKITPVGNDGGFVSEKEVKRKILKSVKNGGSERVVLEVKPRIRYNAGEQWNMLSGQEMGPRKPLSEGMQQYLAAKRAGPEALFRHHAAREAAGKGKPNVKYATLNRRFAAAPQDGAAVPAARNAVEAAAMAAAADQDYEDRQNAAAQREAIATIGRGLGPRLRQMRDRKAIQAELAARENAPLAETEVLPNTRERYEGPMGESTGQAAGLRAREEPEDDDEGPAEGAGYYQPIALFAGDEVYPANLGDVRFNGLVQQRGLRTGPQEAAGFWDTLKDIGSDVWHEGKKIVGGVVRTAAPMVGKMALGAAKNLAKKYLHADGKFRCYPAYGGQRAHGTF